MISKKTREQELADTEADDNQVIPVSRRQMIRVLWTSARLVAEDCLYRAAGSAGSGHSASAWLSSLTFGLNPTA